MVYQVLARKWRPKIFQEIIGQEPIIRSLVNALRSQKIGHAYLFTGTRGVGKTTMARIFARSLRCENLLDDGNACGRCKACNENINDFNIIEIDGASNNSVDEIRELIHNTRYLPTTGKFKVYIVDEVHMLSKSAFNAFLKTLEGPPDHIVFIFATTAPEKLLKTVLSRCQRFDLRNVSLDVLTKQVKKIASQENIRFPDDNSIKQICRAGDGSVRDTLSCLDQVLSYTTDNIITEDVLSHSLGLAKQSHIRELLESLLRCDCIKVSQCYREMIDQNIPQKNMAHGLLDELFETIKSWEKTKNPVLEMEEPLCEEELYWIYEELVQDFNWALISIDPPRVIEIVLRKLAKRRDFLRDYSDTSVKKKDSDGPIKEWDAFLRFLGEKSLVTKVSLERGNTLEAPMLSSGNLEIKLAFPEEAHLIVENLQETQDSLKEHISAFYNIEKEKIFLSMNLIGKKEIKAKDFKSKEQIFSEEKERIKEEKKLMISSNPMVKKVEELFHTKADDIVLNDFSLKNS